MIQSRHSRAALMVALTATACGGSGPEGPVPAHRAVDGLGARSCRFVSAYDEVPAFRDLVRVGTAGNLRLWGDDLAVSDSVELSIRYGDDGRLEWVEAIDGTLDADRVEGLETLVLGALDEYGPSDWGVRVLIVGNEVAATEPSVHCPAEHVGGSAVWTGNPEVQNALRRYFRRSAQRFPVRVALDEQGRVMDVRLLRTTVNRWIDDYIIDYVRTSTFDPKLHDGIGVATILEFQLRFDPT